MHRPRGGYAEIGRAACGHQLPPRPDGRRHRQRRHSRLLNMPAETAGGCPGGWIHIGVAGYLDDRGFLFMVDRLENMIITGEKNAYSA